ncbi:AAA family ATPase [Herpetosiphon llansteffanensis]|uniref:AAA family ATPase n=1 Tax=Herpetosiphon llansteffanensis TaxID=2094568 RepID=UPI000D7C0992|nr:AAA family ATPase [Herpetosiphon llansteffanensis]
MQHFDQFTIHTFRGIRELTLQGLGQVNLLVGMNNSGKTSILEALAVYCQANNPIEWIRVAQRRDGRGNSLARETILESIKWLFPQTKIDSNQFYEGSIALSSQGQFNIHHINANFKEFIGYNQKMIDQESNSNDIYEQKGADILIEANQYTNQHSLFSGSPYNPIHTKFQIWENEPFRYRSLKPIQTLLSSYFISPISHWFEETQKNTFSEIVVENNRNELIDILHAIEPNIKNIEILQLANSAAKFYVEHKKIGLAPINTFGDGLRRILTIALAIQSVKGGVLLIDELETAIHQSVLGSIFTKVVSLCKKYDVQLFVTTHSLEAVDALISANQSDLSAISAYHLDTKDHQTIVKRYNGDLLQRLRYERGLDVR